MGGQFSPKAFHAVAGHNHRPFGENYPGDLTHVRASASQPAAELRQKSSLEPATFTWNAATFIFVATFSCAAASLPLSGVATFPGFTFWRIRLATLVPALAPVGLGCKVPPPAKKTARRGSASACFRAGWPLSPKCSQRPPHCRRDKFLVHSRPENVHASLSALPVFGAEVGCAYC